MARVLPVVIGLTFTAANVLPGDVVAQGPQRVEVIGSARRDLPTDPAAPVTVIRAEDLVKAGITTAEQALRRISAHQSNQGLSQNVGEFTGALAEADLRGLGPDKTLVLLNGRRLAPHAYDGAAVDLNAIPISAIDRIEVVRDGASAIYGSDAISGVIDFILRREVVGFEAAAEAERPAGSGGDSRRLSVTAGAGELGSQGFNLFGSIDVRRQHALRATDRAFSRSGVIRSADGEPILLRTDGTSFPGDLDGYEPALAAGCAPPGSIADPKSASCRYDAARDVDLIPWNQQLTGLGSAKFALDARHLLSLEALHAQTETRSTQTPTPVSMVLPVTSSYWIAGRPSTEIEGFGRGGVVNWRIAPAGLRVSATRSVARRLLALLEGAGQALDYQLAMGAASSEVSDALVAGFVDGAAVQQGLLDGTINPFGPQSSASGAALNAANVVGPLVRARSEVISLDGRLGMPLIALPGGPLTASTGFELRRERLAFDLTPNARRTAASGLELSDDTQGARQHESLFAELIAPWTPLLRTSAAARLDRYSDQHRVLSPKLGLDWQAAPGFRLRSSVNAGFRAPTLYELHQPRRLSLSVDAHDDPELCPDGVAVDGVPQGAVCAQQLLVQSGGPSGYGRPPQTLSPERSKMASAGFTIEAPGAAKGWVFGVDLWWLQLDDEIDVLSEDAVLDDPERFEARIVRCSALDARRRAALATCLNYPAFNPIAYVDAPIENSGEIRTRGIDVSLAHDGWRTAFGQFSINFEGSYVDRYTVRRLGGPPLEYAGAYADDLPIFRWQHSAWLDWSLGKLSATLSQRFKSGYRDQNGDRRVHSYSVIDLSFGYTGLDRISLTLGIKNLLDTRPPYSNQDETPQANFDPRFTDPLGRTLTLRVAYRFF